ncbi:TRAP transporter substrate-binding protein [Paracandidimonas soli]|uniref:Tripartite ATP-independent transporter DctP family solute receptor n=1 Tax=Paracandidimonas soli TaxID=1917182 RepID=A0A4V2VQ92_9BURK|nr:TRAP transporter substrate-binding protein [Paracandidimonas soli]TCU93709.1 tripartite ATP-independent transporter DctP family solute receptor [Paracandidimonas soli]
MTTAFRTLTASFLTAAGIALAAPAATAATTIKIANFFPDAHPVNVALREVFKPAVEEQSKGELRVRIYANGALGGDERLYNSVRGGTLEIAIIGTIMEKEVDYVGIAQQPFLFTNYDHARNVLRGPIGDSLVADFKDKLGLEFLGWGVQGFRVIASSKPIKQFSDFQGLRLRFPGIENMVAIGQALGANVTPLPINEVFGALEQRVVDGVENPYPNLYTAKWYELTKYVLESNHVFSPNLYVANERFWNKLSAEQQAVVRNAVQASTAREWELLISEEAGVKETLQKEGVEITVPSEEFRGQLQQAVQDSYAKLYARTPGAEAIVKQIREAK